MSASDGIPTNGTPTDGIPTGAASICCGIEPVRVGPGKHYSFPFAGAVVAIAAAVARARV